MILGNKNDSHRGRKVRFLRERTARQKNDVGVYVAAVIEAGELATVFDVESHGMNPWTRYGLRTADGRRVVGAIEGVDFRWAAS